MFDNGENLFDLTYNALLFALVGFCSEITLLHASEIDLPELFK